MPRAPSATLIFLILTSAAALHSRLDPCLGEFTRCPDSGVCTMSSHWCGAKSGCKRGQYLCPSDSRTCVDSAADYAKCPGIKGTHLDWTLGTEARLDFLVAHTSLSAQIGQLHNTAPELLELGVPEYQWLNDDQHGVARTPARATVFPNGVGLGATFSHATLRAVGAVVGREARGLHNGFLASDPRRRQMTCNGCGLTLYAPNLNLVRDPRWGRAQEVYGEDPTHMGELVVEFVRGAQNNTAGRTDADGYLQAGTCCKHVAVYNTEGHAGGPSRMSLNVDVNARDLWETYLPAFQACVVRARSSHAMCSYNSLNGVPTCGSRGLLTAVLRETWRWDGFVVSDYDAWANIALAHHYNATLRAGAAQGLNAGIDQEGGSALAISTLPAAIRDGLTTPAAVARAFRNLFRLRIRLGMLDPPTHVSYNALRYNATELASNRRHLAVAREAALELMTLLENKGGALPLDAKVGRLAVVGPQANVSGVLFGNYAGSANKGSCAESPVAGRRLGRDDRSACPPRRQLGPLPRGGAARAARRRHSHRSARSRRHRRARVEGRFQGRCRRRRLRGRHGGRARARLRPVLPRRRRRARGPLRARGQRPAHHRAASRPAEDGRRLACRNGWSARLPARARRRHRD